MPKKPANKKMKAANDNKMSRRFVVSDRNRTVAYANTLANAKKKATLFIGRAGSRVEIQDTAPKGKPLHFVDGLWSWEGDGWRVTPVAIGPGLRPI